MVAADFEGVFVQLLMRALLLTFATALGAQTYEKDIIPIFRQYCHGCHAGTVKMGSLDLDSFEGVMRGGNAGTIVVPGKPAESRLYLSISGQGKPAMPMDGRKLAAGELDAVKRWIERGALSDPKLQPAPVSTARLDIKPRVAVKPASYSMAWNGSVLAAGGYKRVRLFDGAGKPAGTLDGHAEAVRGVALSADGKRLAAAGGQPAVRGEVKIWNLASKQVEATIQGHSDCIYAVAFSPDGKLMATASYDKMIYLWDAATGAQVRALKDHIDAVYALAFTADGSRLLSASADRGVKVWDPHTGERLVTFTEATDGLAALAVSPDGKRVAAAGGDKTIRIWSLKEGLQTSLIAHEDTILKLAFSPDGTVLASASADRSIKLFRAGDLTELGGIGKQTEWVTGLAFSQDGKKLAATRLDGSLEFYEMESLRNAPAATRTANR